MTSPDLGRNQTESPSPENSEAVSHDEKAGEGAGGSHAFQHAKKAYQSFDFETARTLLDRRLKRTGTLSERAYRVLIESLCLVGAWGEARRVADRAASQHLDGGRIGWLSRAIDDRVPALDAVVRFAGQLSGEDVIVFGSAPQPSLGDYAGEKIISCNGSASSLWALFGLTPQVSVIHAHVFYRSGENDAEVRKSLQKVGVLGQLIILDNFQDYEAELIEDKASAIFRLHWLYRIDVAERLLGVRLPFLDISTGALAAALALFCGARSVRLAGFSISSKGHSYNDAGHYRNHVVNDVAFYALLGARGFAISATDPLLNMIFARKLE